MQLTQFILFITWKKDKMTYTLKKDLITNFFSGKYSWKLVLLIPTKWKYYIPYLRLDMCYPMGKDKAGSSHGGTANWASLNSKISSNIHFFSLHRKYGINSLPFVFIYFLDKSQIAFSRVFDNSKLNKHDQIEHHWIRKSAATYIFFLAQETWN